jgi:hypothetical protein
MNIAIELVKLMSKAGTLPQNEPYISLGRKVLRSIQTLIPVITIK